MICTKKYEIQSCDDAELGITRSSKLEFLLTYDDEKEISAIVCSIPGCGNDAQTSYKEHLAQSIANELNVAVLSVNYHGIGNREFLGATKKLDNIDKLIFKTSCEAIGFKLDDDFDNLADDYSYVESIATQLNTYIGMLKLQNKLKIDYRMNISFTTIHTKGEYQNFGIMAAIDIINAILYIKNNKPFNDGGGYLPCVLVGSSHGGYLAGLCAKIAPWVVDAVVDNSSWNLSSNIPKNYNNEAFKTIGFGKEIDYINLSRLSSSTENFVFHAFEKTFWTSNTKSKNYFCPSRYQIRDLNYYEHLIIQSNYKKAIYICFHSAYDEVAPIQEKIFFYENLQKLQFRTNFYLFEKESQLDGKFIKSLAHGMDMSIKTLILKCVPPILDALNNSSEFSKAKEISYSTDEWVYNFKESENKLVLTCSKN